MRVAIVPIPVPSVRLIAHGPTLYDTAEREYLTKVREYLLERGFTGPATGEEFRIPQADGYARYMVAERGRSMILIHLPLGDAWSAPAYMTRGITQADVRAQIKQTAVALALFNKSKRAK